MKKITKEAMENGSMAYRVIEEHLTSICKNEDIAEKILAEEKTRKLEAKGEKEKDKNNKLKEELDQINEKAKEEKKQALEELKEKLKSDADTTARKKFQ